MKKITLGAATILLIFAGCYNDKYDKLYPPPPISTNTCDTNKTISYDTVIKPIIVASCYNPTAGTCHNAVGSAVSRFNYETSITALQANAASGALVTDITWQHTAGHNNMPLGSSQLSACDINEIIRWVNEGAPNN
jgi:hypothetical protein